MFLQKGISITIIAVVVLDAPANDERRPMHNEHHF
jgi:hypothetical protein